MAEIHMHSNNPERALYLLSGAAEVARSGYLEAHVEEAVKEAIAVVHLAFQALLRACKGARHRKYKEMYSNVLRCDEKIGVHAPLNALHAQLSQL